MKNEKLTLETKQELSQIFEFVAQHTNSLFEQNGSIMNYAYETELVEDNGENGYGIFDGYVIDKLEKVDTAELITYIDQTFIKDNLENDLVELEVAIELSIIANYWLMENGNIQFFTFMYEALERSEMCGVVFAQELLMYGIDLVEENMDMDMDKPITVICIVEGHGEFSITPNDHLGNNQEQIAYGCPKCEHYLNPLNVFSNKGGK